MKNVSAWLMGLMCGVSMLLMAACEDGLYYTEYKELSPCEWDSRDTLVFEIPVSERDVDADVTFGVRYTSKFNYREMVVGVEQLCDGHAVAVTPVNIQMYEGDRASGDGMLVKCSYSQPLRLRMKAGHRYVFRLKHRMRLNPLDEILAVGISVNDSWY